MGSPERDGAVKRLQMAIARLRKALEPLETDEGGVLRTVSGGYLLAILPGELDADVFAGLLRDGRRALEEDDPARASELLGEALGLWRGPALAEVASQCESTTAGRGYAPTMSTPAPPLAEQRGRARAP